MEVSNPYNIENIDKDYNSYADIIIDLPEEETILYQNKGSFDSSDYRPFSIAIPSGVNVIKYYNAVPGDMWITNLNNNLIWDTLSDWNNTTYVGVTPLKTYRLQYDGYDIGNFSISYSKSINEIIPDGTDY